MNLITAFIAVPVLTSIFLPFLSQKWKKGILIAAILMNSVISGYYAINALIGQSFEVYLNGNIITGAIPIRIDALSGWFMLVINFVFITGGFYGFYYLKGYNTQDNNINLHSVSFVLLHFSLTGLCVIQNSIVFLIVWEIMALSAFLLVIFEHEKTATIQAGINYFIQSHISIVFLMVGFLWVAIKTGSYDFRAITAFTLSQNSGGSLLLFLCLFIGFAIKAGFVPFHTWLPYAHPAAPAHISGIMSGVIIKIGIYGILRIILLIKTDYVFIGYFILVISVISGLYGVMLAIVQHNLKKLLAYHSIENIGIIGIGIGVGCIGLGTNNLLIASLGFAGAMLHVLNHALFKSLLFYCSGNVYQSVHNLNLESLGGLIKKMPQTAILFLVASLAICGIPPFNGFISEFLIYKGLYQWFQNASLVSLLAIIFSILGLVLIGGLALICFTKAFGVIFLGNHRSVNFNKIKEVPFIQLLPLYLITLVIMCIGLFPDMFLKLLNNPVNLLSANIPGAINTTVIQKFWGLNQVVLASWIFIILSIIVLTIRKFMMSDRKIGIESTWACGYNVLTSRQQYTAGSFVRTYTKLFSPVLLFYRTEKEILSVFPSEGHYESHSYDKIEKIFIDNPLRAFKSLMGKFIFLQNGRLQFYIIYGIIFIVSVICIPLVYEKILLFINYLKML